MAPTAWVVGVCVLLAVGLRLPFLRTPLGSDEAGLLLVVRHWDPGSGLYGDYWVDRPPLLLGTFWLADRLAPDEEVGVRLMGCLAAAVLVTSAVIAGHLVGGRRGGWAAGLVAAALGSSYLLVGHQANGMVQATAVTMAGCCLWLVGLRHRERSAWLWVASMAAGSLGMAAVLVKQNFFGALAFGAVLVVTAAAKGQLEIRRAVEAAAAGVAGALATLAAVAGWAVLAGVDLGGLSYAVVEFRADATRTLTAGSMAAPMGRIGSLTLAFVGSGLVIFVALLVLGGRRGPRQRATAPHHAGIAALAAVALVGIVLGGSWWRHYLLQLVPAAALAAALLAPRADKVGATMRAAVGVAVTSALLAAGIGAVHESEPTPEVAVGRFIDGAAHPEDTGFVAWGHAEALLYADLTSPYPYLWSLPARTLDPDLDQLVDTLRGSRAPTWVVRMNSFNSWGVDRDGRLTDAIRERYRHVASVCGGDIYLLGGEERHLPLSAPRC